MTKGGQVYLATTLKVHARNPGPCFGAVLLRDLVAWPFMDERPLMPFMALVEPLKEPFASFILRGCSQQRGSVMEAMLLKRSCQEFGGIRKF